MKKLIGGAIPFVIIHFICCGSILIYLIGSGYLLKLTNESQNKYLLIPSLLLLSFAWWRLRKQNTGLLKVLLLIVIYLITSYVFIVYLFIPWWIPGYNGGPLLP